ncbi:MAG TPA: Mrp/NBP35 family ATP-binding protein [Firmicutes bacterium]|nr:Mrp/NBP35 family ATP-binding protein [Bacillota bacterium]
MDPELGRNIVELGMVKNIRVEGKRATIEVALTVKGCPLQSKIKDDIRREVKTVPGIDSVEVIFGEMTAEERGAVAALARGERPPEAFPRTTVIAVGSGKGGVGKSTLTVNLAFALHDLGHSVGIMDADVYGFSVPRLMGLKGEQPTALDEHTILPLVQGGVKMISAGSFFAENQPLIWRGPILARIVEQFTYDVVWGDPEFLLIDLPPGTGDIPLTIMQLIPKAHFLLVTTPQELAESVAVRIGHMAEVAKVRNLGIIENMSYFICDQCGTKHLLFGEGETDKLAAELNVPVLGRIPFRKAVAQHGDAGEPAQAAAALPEFQAIATRVLEELHRQG